MRKVVQQKKLVVKAAKIVNGMVRYVDDATVGRTGKDDLSYLGEILDTQRVINPLPPVGARIILRETLVVSERLSRSLFESYLLDSLGYPKVYQVMSYTEGIDKPLSKTNKLNLQWTIENYSGYVMQNTIIMVIRISSGYMSWEYEEDFYNKRKMEKMEVSWVFEN